MIFIDISIIIAFVVSVCVAYKTGYSFGEKSIELEKFLWGQQRKSMEEEYYRYLNLLNGAREDVIRCYEKIEWRRRQEKERVENSRNRLGQ